jgi:choline kinase
MELEEGVPIIRHIIDQLRRCGISDIVVVTRSETSGRFRELEEGLRLVMLDTDEEFGNLYSAFIGAGAGDFLLLMSDHIFELEVLRRLLERASNSDKSFVICLDREPSRKASDEGLKVLFENGRPAEAGKELLPVYRIDTGLIWCGAGAPRYFREALKSVGKNGSIKDALNIAARSNDVDYVDVTGLLWHDVDTPEDLEKARRIYWDILRRDIIKSSDGIVSRYFNRQISTRISLWFYRERIFLNSDIVSLAGFLIAVIGGTLALMKQLVLGRLLVQAS